MIHLNEMIDMKKYKPGEKIKCMLLYFPQVKEYRIHTDYSNAYCSFAFIDSEGIAKMDIASLWIELEKEEEVRIRPHYFKLFL